MKNEKGQIAFLNPLVLWVSLIILICLLTGGAPALGQKTESNTQASQNSRYGGKVRVRVIPPTEEGGDKKVVTEDIDGKNNVREIKEETISKEGDTIRTETQEFDKKKVLRHKVVETLLPQGKREVTEGYDCEGKPEYRFIGDFDSSGKKVSFQDEFYLDGQLDGGRIVDLNKRIYKKFNKQTGMYEEHPYEEYEASGKDPFLQTALSKPPRGCRADYKPNEVFGGFSLVREDSEPERFNTYGFDGSFTRYVSEHYGITVDLSYHLRNRGGVDLSKFSYLGGVTVVPFDGAGLKDRTTVFTHALFGGSHFGADFGTASFTQNSFAMKLGGGLDINVNKYLFVRPIEVNYAPTRFGGTWQHNPQINSGIGLRF